MAWEYKVSTDKIGGSSLYAYVGVDWRVGSTRATYDHMGGVTSPYGGWSNNPQATLYWREWDWGTSSWGVWHQYAQDSAHYSGPGDLPIVQTSGYFTRLSYNREVQLDCDVYATTSTGSGTGSAILFYIVPALPPSATTLTATRDSDNKVSLSWSNPGGVKSAVCIERSVDGASWGEVAVLNPSATSWSDTTTSAGHSYSYRFRYYNEDAYGSRSNTQTVTMTPSAPTGISTAAIAGSTDVTVTLENPDPVSTGIKWQYSDDGETWLPQTPNLEAGSPVTSFTANIAGSVYIRVCNTNSVGDSAWIRTADKVTTITPPAAPTLRSPSGGIYDMANSPLRIAWDFNTIDGSEQSAYEIEFVKNGTTTATSSGTTAKSVNLNLNGVNVGDTLDVRVRTKGADPNWSDWSQQVRVTFYTAPTLALTIDDAIVEDDVLYVTGMPIGVSATYTDMPDFTCRAATVSLMQGGRTLYTEDGTISIVNGAITITASLDVSEFLPTNGESYTIVMTAWSSSSLQTSANAPFTVDFMEPVQGELDITNDPETGYASLLATFDNSASDVEYSGATNEQFDTTEGYVKSLTIEGKSEVVASKNLIYKKFENVIVNANGTIANYTGVNTYVAAVQQNQTYTLSYANGNRLRITSVPSPDIYAGMAGTSLIYNGSTYSSPYTLDSGTASYIAFFLASDGNETDVQLEKGSMATSYEAYFDPYLQSIEDTIVIGKNLVLELYSGYIGGSDSTFIQLNSSANGTVAVARIEQSTSYTLYAEPYTGANRRRVVLLDSDPRDNQQHAVGTFSQIVTESSFSSDYTYTFNSGTFSWVMFGMSTSSVAHNPDAVVQIEKGTRATTYEPPSITTITATLRSAGTVNDQLQAGRDTWTVERRIGTRSYQAGDESDTDVLTDGTTTYYALATPTTDTPTSYTTIELGTVATVQTDLDSTFEMTAWDGSADAVSVSVSRVNADGTLTPLITDGVSGSGIVDKYAPLNTPYQYAVSTKAVTQAVKTVYVDNIIETDYWFAYWGENVAKAKWNPDNGGIQVTRPQKTRVYYAGRRDPVSYDGHAVALTETPSWMFIERDETAPFVQLIEDGGRGVYKSCDGWVYHADFDLTLSPSYTAIGYYGKTALTITRIAGDKL